MELTSDLDLSKKMLLPSKVLFFQWQLSIIWKIQYTLVHVKRTRNWTSQRDFDAKALSIKHGSDNSILRRIFVVEYIKGLYTNYVFATTYISLCSKLFDGESKSCLA